MAPPVPAPQPKPIPQKPVQSQHHVASPTHAPKPAPPSPTPPKPEETSQKQGDEGESPGLSLLDRIRENWLKPTDVNPLFRCRFRVDYDASGMISNVAEMDNCGNAVLNDSVRRALWKTQPLPVDPSQHNGGSIVLEFSP